MEHTAVEEAKELIQKDYQANGRLRLAYVMQVLNKANEIFKQQIIDAYNQGDMVGRASIIREIDSSDNVVAKYPEITAEQYYNEKFNR